MRRFASLVALLLLGAPAPALPAASAAPPDVRVWSVTSDVPRSVDFELTFWQRPGKEGVAMTGGAAGTGRAQRVGVGIFVWFGPGSPRLYGADTPACEGCETVWAALGHSGFRMTMKSRGPSRLRLTVPAADVDVRIKAGKGWRVSSLPATAFRYVTAADADSYGADVLGHKASRFQETSLPGGRHGSVAYATLPCGAHGTGEARLTGGSAPRTLTCPPSPAEDPYDTAPVATTWRLAGDATGVNGPPVRLAVVDLPKA